MHRTQSSFQFDEMFKNVLFSGNQNPIHLKSVQEYENRKPKKQNASRRFKKSANSSEGLKIKN